MNECIADNYYVWIEKEGGKRMAYPKYGFTNCLEDEGPIRSMEKEENNE